MEKMCKQRKRGTVNILQDLIHSTVRLERVKVYNLASEKVGHQSHPVLTKKESCSICGDCNVHCQLMTQDEIEIIEELVLSSFATSSPNGFSWICPSCSQTLKRLAKLKTKIQNLIQCLRAVVKITRNKGKDNEKSRKRKNILRIKYKIDSHHDNKAQSKAEEIEICQNEDLNSENNSNMKIKSEPIDLEEKDNEGVKSNPRSNSTDPETPQSKETHAEHAIFETKAIAQVKIEPVEQEDHDYESKSIVLNTELDIMDDQMIHDAAPVNVKSEGGLITNDGDDATLAFAKSVPVFKGHTTPREEELLHLLTNADNTKLQNSEDENGIFYREGNQGDVDVSSHKTMTTRFIPPAEEFPSKSFAAQEVTNATHSRSFEGFRHNRETQYMDYTISSSLHYHGGIVHQDSAYSSSSTKLSCAICHKTFNGNSSLEEHLELTHFSEKDCCPLGCSDKIGNDQEWLQHLEGCQLAKMTEVSLSNCSLCGEMFPNLLLKTVHHLRSHMTYSCHHCSLYFTAKGILNQHILQHDEKEERHLCLYLGIPFPRYSI